ncbi:M48 family metallopeptidase [Acetobacteraceae bacterium KSS12]|uniref:M48 family metallopeptidase n=2 Tax=Rhizosaccharibacter radicis TaxID=2782605 RepID=A0ABT1VSD5_9PROT|nr:M48 family metallopeptidase [Acetobacteraceae bacterium KSS12]
MERLCLPLAGEVSVRWRRNGRARRVSLRIDLRAGAVAVTLPPRAGREAGLALLREHDGWVAARLAALPAAIGFAEGALVPVEGVPHRIRHVPDGRRGVWIEADEIRVSGDPCFLGRRVADYLRREARTRLLGRVQSAVRGSGAPAPRRLAIKDTSSRWGSCSSDGTVMLSWRLLMAPPAVQDYVVAHELAHLRHLDHGTAFWRLVEQLTPHRAHAEAWLKRFGPELLRTG